MQNDLARLDTEIKIGDTMSQCRAKFAGNPNLYEVSGKPFYQGGPTEYSTVLWLKNHPLLKNKTWLLLLFEHGTLKKKVYWESWW